MAAGTPGLWGGTRSRLCFARLNATFALTLPGGRAPHLATFDAKTADPRSPICNVQRLRGGLRHRMPAGSCTAAGGNDPSTQAPNPVPLWTRPPGIYQAPEDAPRRPQLHQVPVRQKPANMDNSHYCWLPRLSMVLPHFSDPGSRGARRRQCVCANSNQRPASRPLPKACPHKHAPFGYSVDAERLGPPAR
jgi:hypothetical protein